MLSEDEADYVEDEEDDDGEEPGDSVSDGDEEGVALTDEELALQLQTEEHHAHMLELAGFGARVHCSAPVPWTCEQVSKIQHVPNSM